MLGFKDLFHLPQVDALISQLSADGPGLVLVAGLDLPDALAPLDGFLSSGRASIFRILMRQMLEAHQTATPSIVVARNTKVVRTSRRVHQQVEWDLVGPSESYGDRIARAVQRRPSLLVVDQLDSETVPAVLEAAQNGLSVLSQLDTAFCGAEVAYHLLDLGASPELLAGLKWVVTVRRVETLCSRCQRPDQPDPAQLVELGQRYPHIPLGDTFSEADGCAGCNHTGRQGSVTAFDILCAETSLATHPEQPSQLPLKEYLLRLAVLGQVSVGEVFGFRTQQIRPLCRLLGASRQALDGSKATLERKLVQLEAANEVLQQRTEALISLQGISQTLVSLTDVDALAGRVCRYACDLCGADRAILYFLQPDGMAKILAVSGWEPRFVGRQLDAVLLMGAGGLMAANSEPQPFAAHPPGVLSDSWYSGEAILRAGLRVPLVAQSEVVGLMFIHTTLKHGFTPGEVAMLQAFANQAAVALQRAGLIDALRDKIVQLEAAQAELLEKEFIKDTFGKLVDPRVRDYLLSGHIDLGGETKEATILFTDIRGFTPMLEKTRPDLVVDLLNRYFERMSHCIAEEGGLVNRFVGDAILAVFGAPLALDSHADAAVRAALKMRTARDLLNEDLREEGQPPIHTGIGIHTGPVLAGNIGSSSRMEYTVIGDTVNLASRIEKLCKRLPPDLIISEATAMQLSDTFSPVYLDAVGIEGKEQPVKLFYL